MALVKNNVSIENVITTDLEKAKALENNVRAKILDMLAEEEMTVEEIKNELKIRGEEKAETTVRHHIDILKNSGMIELSRLEEAGGATQKYYKSNTRVFSYELPEGSDQQLSEAFNTTQYSLKDFIEQLFEKHGNEIEAVAKEMKPCEYCKTQHYEEYIIRELLNKGLTNLSENEKLEHILH